jgi:hypothetical protein
MDAWRYVLHPIHAPAKGKNPKQIGETVVLVQKNLITNAK